MRQRFDGHTVPVHPLPPLLHHRIPSARLHAPTHQDIVHKIPSPEAGPVLRHHILLLHASSSCSHNFLNVASVPEYPPSCHFFFCRILKTQHNIHLILVLMYYNACFRQKYRAACQNQIQTILPKQAACPMSRTKSLPPASLMRNIDNKGNDFHGFIPVTANAVSCPRPCTCGNLRDSAQFPHLLSVTRACPSEHSTLQTPH